MVDADEQSTIIAPSKSIPAPARSKSSLSRTPAPAASRTPPVTRSSNRLKHSAIFKDGSESNLLLDSTKSGATGKHRHSHSRRTSEAINPDALSKALQEFDDVGSQRERERTPGMSPSRKRQRIYGDRYAC